MIITLTPLPDFAPVPRVEIRLAELVEVDGGGPEGVEDVIDGGGAGGATSVFVGGNPSTVDVEFPAGTDRITVWRRCQGRALKVRGAVSRSFSGAVAFLDMEAGFDVRSDYEVECFDGPVSLGRVHIGTAELPGPDIPYLTVVQQPLDPSLYAVVEEKRDVPTLVRTAPGGSLTAEGRSFPTVVSGGPRSGLQGVELEFAAVTREVAGDVWATVGTEDAPQLPVWLVRSRHPLLPRVFFCDTFGLREIGGNTAIGGEKSVFMLTTDEVAPPVPSLVISPLSYTDLDVSFASYAAMDAAFPSYSARDSAWEYAGASGGA